MYPFLTRQINEVIQIGINLVRFQRKNEIGWGCVEGETVIPLNIQDGFIEEIINLNIGQLKEELEKERDEQLTFDEIELLAPITKPQNIICQGVNYSNHRQETGMSEQKPPFNMIFSKTPSSICGPQDAILRPSHVKLLDYEIELGLVIRESITQEAVINEGNFVNYVAGLVIANDISARDVQLTQLQWLKGKSYRTFCPIGPSLFLLEKEDYPQLLNLELTLSVNGEVRQQANTSQLLYKPVETLNELAKIMDLNVGDLVLTGTPGGVAMQLSAEEMNVMTSLVEKFHEKEKVIERQYKIGNYLKDGDVIEATIVSTDGSINLGKQKNVVKSLQLNSL